MRTGARGHRSARRPPPPFRGSRPRPSIPRAASSPSGIPTRMPNMAVVVACTKSSENTDRRVMPMVLYIAMSVLRRVTVVRSVYAIPITASSPTKTASAIGRARTSRNRRSSSGVVARVTSAPESLRRMRVSRVTRGFIPIDSVAERHEIRRRGLIGARIRAVVGNCPRRCGSSPAESEARRPRGADHRSRPRRVPVRRRAAQPLRSNRRPAPCRRCARARRASVAPPSATSSSAIGARPATIVSGAVPRKTFSARPSTGRSSIGERRGTRLDNIAGVGILQDARAVASRRP